MKLKLVLLLLLILPSTPVATASTTSQSVQEQNQTQQPEWLKPIPLEKPIEAPPIKEVEPAQPVSPPSGLPKVLNDAQIQFLGNCESGMTPNKNTGNGFYGAFQFTISTWNNMQTGYERADFAPLDVQIAAVQKLLSQASIFTQFPDCARKMQAAGLL